MKISLLGFFFLKVLGWVIINNFGVNVEVYLYILVVGEYDYINIF